MHSMNITVTKANDIAELLAEEDDAALKDMARALGEVVNGVKSSGQSATIELTIAPDEASEDND